MSETKQQHDNRDLLSIIDQAAIGLIVANKKGEIRHQNQMAIMMVQPLFQQTGKDGKNILDLLEMIAPGIAEKVENFPEEKGFILTQQKQTLELEHEGQKMVRHFFYSINKVSEESIVYSFDDITNYHEAQEELSRLNQEMAIDKSKFEMAAGVLHDIGNAVVGIGSHLTRARRSLEENDLKSLTKLKQFLIASEAKIAQGIGEPKAKALVSLVEGMEEEQNKFRSEIDHTVKEQMGIASHISDILNIQRQYVANGKSRPREKVNLRAIIYDALSILLASIEKRDIKLISKLPEDCPSFLGDQTKLIQVMINLIKNAIDAIDENPNSKKEVHIDLKFDAKKVYCSIKDSGIGFDQEQGQQNFERGYTTKATGTGLGLSSGKGVLESHGGNLELESEGIGKGATAKLEIPLNQNTAE